MNGLEILLIWKDYDIEEFYLKISSGVHAYELNRYESIENIWEFGQRATMPFLSYATLLRRQPRCMEIRK